MKSSLNLSRFNSMVRVWCPENPSKSVVGKNLVTYQGADIVAHLLAGDARYRLARMWFEFDNSGPAHPTAARADTAATVLGEAVLSRDIIRGPLVAQPLLESSDPTEIPPKYTSNRGTYHAISQGVEGEKNLLAFSAAAGSKIFAICLVASPGPGTTIADDLIYARFVLATHLDVGSSGQVAATWMTEAT
jgi:hypothetical protein